jgi:hypothetical protein
MMPVLYTRGQLWSYKLLYVTWELIVIIDWTEVYHKYKGRENKRIKSFTKQLIVSSDLKEFSGSACS